MRVLREKTAAMIIDIQEKFIPHMIYNHELIENMEILVKGFKILDIPMLMTEQYKKGLGETVEPIRTAVEEIEAMEKMTFSCCDADHIAKQIDEMGKKFVILAGIEAHICVLQTAVDLLSRGYIPVVVEDCISSRKENDKKIAVERMRQEGAIITTYESILFELCRDARAVEFKGISQLVK